MPIVSFCQLKVRHCWRYDPSHRRWTQPEFTREGWRKWRGSLGTRDPIPLTARYRCLRNPDTSHAPHGDRQECAGATTGQCGNRNTCMFVMHSTLLDTPRRNVLTSAGRQSSQPRDSQNTTHFHKVTLETNICGVTIVTIRHVYIYTVNLYCLHESHLK